MTWMAQALAKIFIQAQGVAQATAAEPEKPKGPPKSDLEKHQDRMKLRIENNQYVDCVTLGAGYFWALRQRQSHLGEETKVSLGQGLTLSGGPVPVKNVASVCDPVQFQQGWNLYVLWHAQSQVEATRNKLADRLMWYDKLWRYGPTLDIKPEWRVKYAKEFMYKYQELDVDWASKFETDFTLLREFLDRGNNGGTRTPRTAPGGPTHGAGAATEWKRGKRARSRSRSPRRGGGKRAREQGYCYTRIDASKGECKYEGCIFKHECPSCGQDHSAAACAAKKTWDVEKANKMTGGKSSRRSDRQ